LKDRVANLVASGDCSVDALTRNISMAIPTGAHEFTRARDEGQAFSTVLGLTRALRHKGLLIEQPTHLCNAPLLSRQIASPLLLSRTNFNSRRRVLNGNIRELLQLAVCCLRSADKFSKSLPRICRLAHSMLDNHFQS
jgi:hypothetical protein